MNSPRLHAHRTPARLLAMLGKKPQRISVLTERYNARHDDCLMLHEVHRILMRLRGYGFVDRPSYGNYTLTDLGRTELVHLNLRSAA